MRWRILWADSLSVFYHYILFRGKNQTKSTGLPRLRRAARLSAVILALALALAAGGCSITELSSLREFARPYEGEYRCEYAEYGGRDLLADCREVVLALEGENFTLRAVPRRGKVICASGECRYDAAKGVLSLRAELFGKEYRKDVVLRSGKIFFSQMFAGKALVLRFVSSARQG